MSFSRDENNPLVGITGGNTKDGNDAYNINVVNVDNLFYDGNYSTRLSYQNYCAVTQDYYTHHIDEEALRVLET